MPKTDVTLIEEFVAELLLADAGNSVRIAIAKTVDNFPKAKAIEAAFAFVSLAASLEQPIFTYTENDNAIASEMYRAVAAFTADIYAVENLYGPSPTCAQIRDFWLQTKDTFFA